MNRVTLADALCANAAAAVVFAVVWDAFAAAEVTSRNTICLGAVVPVDAEDDDDDNDDDDKGDEEMDEDRVDDAANDAESV